MNTDAETEIINCLNSRDFARAFTTAVRAYGSILRSHVGGLLRDQDRADDAYSTCLFSLWAGIEDFRGESSFFYWAKRIATNAAHNQHRDPWVRKGDRLEDAEQLQAPLPRATTAKIRRTTEKLRVRLARAGLPVQEQLVVALRVDWEFDFNTIEELLGIPAATARMRYMRAKEKLKKVLLANDDSDRR
jgi:RNA polymerase sigma-70 factor (ECF subfamily)